MTTNKNHNSPNVPNLRFPEFEGEWEKIKLKDVCTFYSGGTPSSSNKDYYTGDIPFIRSGELHESCTELFISKDGLNNSSAKIVHKGDLLLALYGATSGDIAISQIEGAINQAILCINTEQSKEYIKAVWQKHVQKILQTYLQGGQGNLSADIVKNISFYFALSKEQDKLANFIRLLDERIATQNKIIEDLKKLKSAIIEKLFCSPKDKQPEIRLHGFSENWQIIRLSEICHRIRCKNTEEQCKRVLTIAAQYGLVSQEEFFNKNVASENLSGYYLLQNGDFAYNKSYSGDYVWGTVKRLDNYEQGVLSPLYICFRPDSAKVDSDFLVYYFESKKWHKAVADIAGEGARNHGLLNISVIDYFNTIHCIPSVDEQKQIAQIMSALLSKIAREQRILNCYTTQRQYLLRQMFI